MVTHPELAGFPVVVEMPVAWGDMDSFQHVNNTVYLRWFEDARIAYFRAIGWEVRGTDGAVGPILARTSCVFRLPVQYPDTVLIGARCDPPERDRFTMHYRVVSRQHDAVAADGDGRIISFHYGFNQKVPLPDAVRAAMLELEASVAQPAPETD